MVKDGVEKHTDNNQAGFKTLCMVDEENLETINICRDGILAIRKILT